MDYQPKEDVMKKWTCWVTAMLLVLGMGVAAYADSPLLSVSPVVAMGEDTKVSIMGAGFKPGQEVALLFTDANGVTADIEAYLDPKLEVNSKGEFYTEWNCGRYISKNLIKPGVTAIKATDGDYNILAHDSILFTKGDMPASGKQGFVDATKMVKMDDDAVVMINGEGFAPGQEIMILYTDVNGATADLEAYLDPKPKADDSGNWSTIWKSGRYVSKKLIKPGVTAIRVTDSDYNVLGHASIAFQ
jgi:hypothetical protein